MVTYVAQRLIAIVFILFVMSLLIFGITQVMPGNVAHMIAGQFATPDVVAAIEAKVIPLFREGRIKPLMDSTFPLEKAADAHRRMESSEHIGKIVLLT